MAIKKLHFFGLLLIQWSNKLFPGMFSLNCYKIVLDMKNDFIHLRNSSLKKLTYTLPKKIETVNTILKLPKLSFSKKIKTLPRPVFTSEEELF